MVMIKTAFTDWIAHFLACMGGCFGCCSKSTPIIAVDEPSKGLKIQGRTVKKPTISDDFWSSSTCDLENSAVQSQRSISSISISNQTLNHCGGNNCTSSHSEFVNHGKSNHLMLITLLIAGLLLWNQVRLEWIGSSKSKNQTQHSWEPKSSWPATYESLLGSRNPFPRPIPLNVELNISPLRKGDRYIKPLSRKEPEMVDFLVDVWEHEGLYD
ncbi:hypothetical protein Pint_13010 [Pistacia integerrima]|uniref:Uncharacterized protein n=1 Tax=Pistacia integerrima TaxID=434235 RepID=A0ACC0Y9A1_9ROSI|nr:hypothetical protein Pint_13010 [Pistacia integerrima]